MKTYLIATKNGDKYEITKALLERVLQSKVSFESLEEVNIEYEVMEKGSILERAEQKAREHWSHLNTGKKEKYSGVIGIDDGFSLNKNEEGDPNSKELTSKILQGEFVSKNQTVWLKRGFAVCNDNDLKSCSTSIPFTFLGSPENIAGKNGIYPLNCVLAPLGQSNPIEELNFEETTDYYLKFCAKDLKNLIN